jgi:hypothetical protein
VALLLLSILAAAICKLRFEGLFACPASGYGSNAFLSDCTSSGYGDYDHGAFWFDLEPDARRAAAGADTLFLGNSRLQFALSTHATEEWFARLASPYYLLGFSHFETIVYTGPLLSKIQPRARVYVINVDRFFDDRVSPPTEQILQGRDIEAKYAEKRVWQVLHKTVCGRLPSLCGSSVAVYRERGNGAWRLVGAAPFQARSVSEGGPTNTDRWPQFAALAKDFVARLDVDRDCIILTLVPTVQTRRSEAAAVAESLGLPLMSPQLDDLLTFDGSHLDGPSAERWSAAFLQLAGPRIRQCIGRSPSAGPDRAPIRAPEAAPGQSQ